MSHRRLDAIGALVLLGIAIGTARGLATSNPRLVPLEGSVLTALFAGVCLASLSTGSALRISKVMPYAVPPFSRCA